MSSRERAERRRDQRIMFAHMRMESLKADARIEHPSDSIESLCARGDMVAEAIDEYRRAVKRARADFARFESRWWRRASDWLARRLWPRRKPVDALRPSEARESDGKV